jgi:hypothetical protein
MDIRLLITFYQSDGNLLLNLNNMETPITDKQIVEYLKYLKTEFTELCKTPDRSIKEMSYRSVLLEMFQIETNNEKHFDVLSKTLNDYRISKRN